MSDYGPLCKYMNLDCVGRSSVGIQKQNASIFCLIAYTNGEVTLHNSARNLSFLDSLSLSAYSSDLEHQTLC